MTKQYDVVTVELPENIKKGVKLTNKNVALVLADVLALHIGKQNAITKEKLFYKVYRKPYRKGYLQEFLWDYIRKGLHYLRNKSFCFPIIDRTGRETLVYIPRREAEYKVYDDHLEECKKRIELMQQKAEIAQSQGWHRKSWWSEEGKLLTVTKKQLKLK
jgi:hypothetical protein